MINPPPHRPLIASRTSLHHQNVARCWHIHVLVHAHDARVQCTLGQRVVRNDTQKQRGERFIYFRRLFMSGCMYSREGMASYGGPIHILFAPYDGLPAQWTRKRRRCTVGGVHGLPARLLCSCSITGLFQCLSNRSRCNRTSPISAGNTHA